MIIWEGTAALKSRLRMIKRMFPQKRDMFLRREAELLKTRTKTRTPVDTGNLRGNWHSSDPAGGSIDVYNNVEYAPHVEFGHRIVAFGKDTGRVKEGVYMLRDGLDETQKNFVVDAEQILAELFK